MKSGQAQAANRNPVATNIAFPASPRIPSIGCLLQLGLSILCRSQISISTFKSNCFRLSAVTIVNIGSCARSYRVTTLSVDASQPLAFTLQPFPRPLPKPELPSPNPELSARKPELPSPNVELSAPKSGLARPTLSARNRLNQNKIGKAGRSPFTRPPLSACHAGLPPVDRRCPRDTRAPVEWSWPIGGRVLNCITHRVLWASTVVPVMFPVSA